MKIFKITLSILSLLMLIVCFITATPIAQQQKTSPFDKAKNQITPPSKPEKKLSFIQKIILKKVKKKMKKSSDEDKYRGWAEFSIFFGVFTILLWIIGLVMSIVMGTILMYFLP